MQYLPFSKSEHIGFLFWCRSQLFDSLYSASVRVSLAIIPVAEDFVDAVFGKDEQIEKTNQAQTYGLRIR